MFNFNDDYQMPVENVDGEEYIRVQPNHSILKSRRMQLGLTQQQIADSCGINIRQYQKFESGERNIATTSMRIGLAICSALQLDPYRFG